MKKNTTWTIVIAVHIIIIISIFFVTNDSDAKKSTNTESEQSNLGNGLNAEKPPEITPDASVKKGDPVGTVGQDPDIGYTIYKVKKGDSGSAIARKQEISWANIKKFNKLSSDNLKVGQKLKIPTLK